MPPRTYVLIAAILGIVLVVFGTSRYLAPPPDRSLDRGPVAQSIVLYVEGFVASEQRAAGARYPRATILQMHYDGSEAASYRKMDASEEDAKFAIFTPPLAGQSWYRPLRISWHDDSSKGEIALPIAYQPDVSGRATVWFPGLTQPVITQDEADALRPLLLSHQPMIATVDIEADSPRLYNLRAASDAEIAAHYRGR